jgi:hypothetical protein
LADNNILCGHVTCFVPDALQNAERILMKTLTDFCALALGMLLWSTANAVVILVLDNDGVPASSSKTAVLA